MSNKFDAFIFQRVKILVNNSAFYHQIFTTLNQIVESEDESFLIAYDGGQILLNQAEITHHDDELLVFRR